MNNEENGIFNISNEEYKNLLLGKIQEIFQASEFMKNFNMDNFISLETEMLEGILIKVAEFLHFESNASKEELDVLWSGMINFYWKLNNIYKEGIREWVELDQKQEQIKTEAEIDSLLNNI